MKRSGVLAALGMVLILTLGPPGLGRGEPPAATGGVNAAGSATETAAETGVAAAAAAWPAERPVPMVAEPIRCRVALTVTGVLLAPAGREAAPIHRPIRVEARFDFEERPVAEAGDPTVSRVYTDAVASLRIGDDEATTSLAADARRLFFVRHGTTPQPYLEAAFLTGDEHDLLSLPFDAMLLDELLPDAAVAVGAAWDIPADLTAGLLAIDTVESGRIEARLEDVVAGRARTTFAGSVDGWVDGVPTHVDVSGSFAARATWADDAAGADGDSVTDATDGDASARRYCLQPHVDQVAAVIREQRQAGHIGPGLDVEARLAIARSPVPATATVLLRPEAHGTEPARRQGGAGGPGRIWHRDADGRFDLVRDIRWRLVEDGPSGLVMRLVDRGALVGQCSVVAVSAAGTVAPTTADVQRDIEQSLAGQVVRVDETAEEERGDGVRIVRIVSSGSAGGLPFVWIHNVLVAPSGARVDVTFMVQESMRGRFADADRALIAALSLGGDGDAAAGRPTEPSAGTSVPAVFREARASGEKDPPAAAAR